MLKWILLPIAVVLWISFVFSFMNISEPKEINLCPLTETIVLTPNLNYSKVFVPDIDSKYYFGFELANNQNYFGKYIEYNISKDNKKIKIRKSITPLISSGDDFGYGFFDLVEGEKYTLNLRFDSIPKNMTNDSIKLRICCSQAAVSVGIEYGKSFNKEYGNTLKIIYLVVIILFTLIVVILFGLQFLNHGHP
jgi:hypothetical protein